MPRGARSAPLALLTSLERLFRTPLQGLAVTCSGVSDLALGVCAASGVCACTSVSALLGARSVLWLALAAGFGTACLARLSPLLGAARWALFAVFCVLVPVSFLLSAL